MISYVIGQVSSADESFAVVEVNGIGYQIFMSAKDLAKLPDFENKVKIFTHLYVKEDILQLYGFLDGDDLALFQLLINVSGVGPKAAMGILCALSADDVRFAILSEDIQTLTKAPGIGKKTAQRIVLDLKDKLCLEEAFEKKLSNTVQQNQTESKNKNAADEAVLALVSLGYSNSEALKAVRSLEIKEEWTAEDVIREALKAMVFF